MHRLRLHNVRNSNSWGAAATSLLRRKPSGGGGPFAGWSVSGSWTGTISPCAMTSNGRAHAYSHTTRKPAGKNYRTVAVSGRGRSRPQCASGSPLAIPTAFDDSLSADELPGTNRPIRGDTTRRCRTPAAVDERTAGDPDSRPATAPLTGVPSHPRAGEATRRRVGARDAPHASERMNVARRHQHPDQPPGI